MIEIVKNPDNNDFVTAYFTAEDLINLIVANETKVPREGYICINIVPAVCAKVTKKAKAKSEFAYGEDEYDDEVTKSVMAWLDENLISKRAKTFKQVGSIEDVMEEGYSVAKNQFTAKFNNDWLMENMVLGSKILTERKKNPNHYSNRHLTRIGILDGIRCGKNLPLKVQVKVRNRGESLWY